MSYLLTQIFWCLLTTAILFFSMGWLVWTWYRGKQSADSLIGETERTSWQTSLDILKARLEVETSDKVEAERALAEVKAQLVDHRAIAEQREAKAKQLEARLTDLEPRLAAVNAEAIALKMQLARLEQEVVAVQPDDLKQIRGIGPVLEKRLNGLGVRFFREIAGWSREDIREEFRSRVERDKWVESAREEHFKKYGERLETQTVVSASSF